VLELPDRRMIRFTCVAALLFAATLARAAAPPELLGRWVMQGEPARVLELKAGGTGTIDGQPLTWSVEGTRLTITDPGGTDTTGWKVTGDRLVLTAAFGTELIFTRVADRPGPSRDAASEPPR
jgi:hypothetical protein